eukprot:SAG25_NODE_11413_length_305_cov_0.728155_1_plen_22_part_10
MFGQKLLVHTNILGKTQRLMGF